MTATEIKLELPYYLCTVCDEWTQGEPIKLRAKDMQEATYVDEDYFFMSVEEWDRLKLVDVLKCEDCGHVVLDPPTEHEDPIIQLAAGHLVYECDGCETWYIDQDRAESCCR